MPYFKGKTQEWPRKEFLYWTDGGQLACFRWGAREAVFMEQRVHGYEVWEEPFFELHMPKLFNLLIDPFERADHEAISYPNDYSKPAKGYKVVVCPDYCGFFFVEPHGVFLYSPSLE